MYVELVSPEILVHGPNDVGPLCHCFVSIAEPPTILAVNVDDPPTQICPSETVTETVGSGCTTTFTTLDITGVGQALPGGSTV